MKSSLKRIFLLLAAVMTLSAATAVAAEQEERSLSSETAVYSGETESLAGRKLSVLGASISTYAGTSNGAAADTTNSTIRKNVKYYPNTTIPNVELEDTWWMQTAEELGFELLVNNAWSGSAILLTRSGTVGAYVDRCVQLHDDTGENAGEEPDIICIQMGFNDFSYGKDTLGTAEIDYDALITTDGYGTPATTMEATAIMLDKMTKRYPHAEIYMFNHFKRVGQGAADTALMEHLNADIAAVCERYGVTVVDLYNTLTSPDYIGDGRVHPNPLGMDVICEAVKTAILGNHSGETVYTVRCDLEHVSADCVAEKKILAGQSFSAELGTESSYEMTVRVTMGGKDITDSVYENGVVTIDAVTDDVTITAKGFHAPRHYRWQLEEDVFDGEDNPLTLLSGTVTDGWFSNVCYQLSESVVLAHDLPWVVEWKSEGSWKNSETSTGGRVFTSTDVNAEYNARYIFKSAVDSLIAMGEKTTTGSHNYGVALADYGIDGAVEHIYRLENRIAEDGSNMIWLYVDGEEIAPMTEYFIGTKRQNTTSDWLSGKNFVFPYMGTDTHGFSNCSISYIDVQENGDAAASEIADYSGKVISIMGDSISTFAGYIPEADGFNLAHRARYPDTSRIPDVTDVNQTWWMQVIHELDAKLGVNESWAGSTIYWGDNMSTKNADTGEKAAMASLTRIQNLGSNGTPDVIFLYGGGNDKAKGVTVGSFDPSVVPTEADLVPAKWETFADSCVAAIMRMRHYYPDAEIVVLMSVAGSENDYIRVMREICAYFEVPFLFLNEYGLIASMHPDGSHPNAEGMDVIAAAVLDVFAEKGTAVSGENTVYTVTHKLSNAAASKHYYKGVSAGRAFEETLSGEDLKVTVTMGGKDITASCYRDGKICITSVSGNVVVTAKAAFTAEGHLQQLPEQLCAGTNLWTALEPENIYYTVNGWGLFTNQPDVHSVTFPVKAGERIWATSFGKTSSGIGTRITWFDENGVLETVARDIVYAEFAANGYVTAPAGAAAVNIPMGDASKDREIYLLDREHPYEGTACIVCGKRCFDYKGKVISILSASTSTFAGYIPEADGFNLAHRARYPQSNLLTDVNDTWWMQLITELDAKLGINDSWAGSQVLNSQDTNSGDLGPDAAMASLTRIQNLGSNGTPDLILFFGAGNDMGRGVPLGSFDPAAAPTQVDLTTKKWETFADAYTAAIMRLQYYYPDTKIVAMTSYAMPSYVTAAKLEKYGAVIKAICDHYGVPYIRLEECGVTFDMLPDKIHPNAEGMDRIAAYVKEKLLAEIEVEFGEHTVYSVEHALTGVKASLGHYKGISAGKAFAEMLTGEDFTVTVTMGGRDITAECYSDGKIFIEEVTGDIIVTAKGTYNCDGHLQQLPEDICCGTNLWEVLMPENIYYTVNGWGNTAAGTTWSVTFPVEAGERIWATSFGPVSTNGSTADGVRVTWFDANGVLKTVSREEVYAEFSANGYLTAPEGAEALNLPMTNNKADYAVYLLNRSHRYENDQDPSCDICGEKRNVAVRLCGSVKSRRDGAKVTLQNIGETVAENGSYAFENVEKGSYKLTVKQDGCLTYTVQNIEVDGMNDVTLPEIQLVAGDVNGDDLINARDIAVFRRDFGKRLENVINPLTDIDGNGMVNAMDITALRRGFGKSAVKDCTIALLNP